MLPKHLASISIMAGVLAFCRVLVGTQPGIASDFEAKREEMRRRFEQRKSEMQQRWTVRSAASGVSSTSGVSTYGGNSQTSKPNTGQRSKPSLSRPGGATSSRYGTSSSSSPTSFNPASAPSPDLCFLKFVDTAKNATTADAILAYLPENEARVLPDRQHLYDPQQAAQRRASFLQRDPKLTPDQLDHLTEPPSIGTLKRWKRIATKVIRVKSFTIKGNIAKLTVSTYSDAASSAYGKPMKFPYSTATVEMVGEGNYWKFKSYNDSNISYTEEH
jgi:hypothetical protein